MKAVAGAVIFLSGAVLFGAGAIAEAMLIGPVVGGAPKTGYSVAHGVAMGAGVLFALVGLILFIVGWNIDPRAPDGDRERQPRYYPRRDWREDDS